MVMLKDFGRSLDEVVAKKSAAGLVTATAD
jgi:hypothetical protein